MENVFSNAIFCSPFLANVAINVAIIDENQHNFCYSSFNMVVYSLDKIIIERPHKLKMFGLFLQQSGRVPNENWADSVPEGSQERSH